MGNTNANSKPTRARPPIVTTMPGGRRGGGVAELRRRGSATLLMPPSRPGERGAAQVGGDRPQLLLDAEELVELRDPFGAGRRAGLDHPAVRRDGQVGDRGVLGLAAAVRHDGAVAVAGAEPDG